MSSAPHHINPDLPAPPGMRSDAVLGEVSEAQLLRALLPGLHGSADVLVGPGDDTAVLAPGGPSLLTTDTMVREVDWRDEWSTPDQVGAKLACQNLADIAAMGGRPAGAVLTLVAPDTLPVQWARAWMRGAAAALEAAGACVAGGDLSGTHHDVVMVSITLHGWVPPTGAVLRSGATPGDVVAVAGTMGTSAAGLECLQRGCAAKAPEWVAYHCAPVAPYAEGPRAAAAGATSMIDLSDGLARDAHRVADASGVLLRFRSDAIDQLASPYESVLGAEAARQCVVAGGEEHSLLATFPTLGHVPDGWCVLGEVEHGTGVLVGERELPLQGWDHFSSDG